MQDLNTVIKNGGFYGRNHIWNSIVKIPGDSHLYRKRVETLIIQGKSVFIKKKPNGEYFLPGGSTEKDIPDIDQAVNECREEARINVKNIRFTGITYKKILNDYKDYTGSSIKWDGMITDIYVAEYDSMDKNPVDKEDQDPFIKSGRFYPFNECFKMFRKEHKEALFQYIKDKNSEEEVEESYISNYFSNKKFLKQIGKNPEIDKGSVDKILFEISDYYKKGLTKSAIKRQMKNPDANTIFYPVLSFDFTDGNTITIAISYGYYEGTPACAVNTDSYGDLVILYKNFFSYTKELQKFILLHEIGHIRLGHTNPVNQHRKILGILGDVDTTDYRVNIARKGKSVYEEINADLYAVLSGSKMYSILGILTKNDYDDKYNYRVTNVELANRYKSVYNMYDKYKVVKEAYEEVRHGDYSYMSEFTSYDFICLNIHDYVYESDLDDNDRRYLSKVLYEYCIGKEVPRSKELSDKIYTLYNDLSSNKNIITEKVDTLNDLLKEKSYRDRSIYSSNNPLNKKENNYTENNYIDEFVMYKDYYKNVVYEKIDEILENIKSDLLTTGSLSDNKERLYNVLEKTMKRSQLPDSKFGIPELRKYPLDTRRHVYSAIKLFGHYANTKYADELARHIISAMRRYHIPKSAVGEKNSLYKYL